MNTKKSTLFFAAIAAIATSASANLVQNADFEQTTLTSSQQFAGSTQVANWSTTGYNFLFMPGTADSTGAARIGWPDIVTFWGPNTGVANGFEDSPTGGNWIGADGAYLVGPIQQTINNLVVGQNYQLSFDWAAAQQSGYYGPTTEGWIVSLGNQTFATEILHNPNQGFQDWRQQTFNFTATSTSEVLSFLAAGTPTGNPPFSLLDNVQLNAVPEPGSLALMLAAMGVLVANSRRRGNASKSEG